MGASGSRSSTHALIAACGIINRGGAADGGGEAAQLAIVAEKAIGASRIHRCRFIRSTPGLGRGVGGHTRDRQGLVVTVFETAGLVGHPFDFEPARTGIGDGGRGAVFRRPQAPP